MPTTSLDVIWIVFGNRRIQPKGGKVIYISKQELMNLIVSSEQYHPIKSGRSK